MPPVRGAGAVASAVRVHAHAALRHPATEDRVSLAHVRLLWHVGCMRGDSCHRTPRVTRHTSHVTRHTSHVTRHTSRQVLQLWDRVIAYDSLLPIPVLAAAVFVFRFARHTSHVIARHTSHVTPGLKPSWTPAART